MINTIDELFKRLEKKNKMECIVLTESYEKLKNINIELKEYFGNKKVESFGTDIKMALDEKHECYHFLYGALWGLYYANYINNEERQLLIDQLFEISWDGKMSKRELKLYPNFITV